jgi:hypothetical protein
MQMKRRGLREPQAPEEDKEADFDEEVDFTKIDSFTR